MSSLTFSDISILDYSSIILLSFALFFSLRGVQIRLASATKKYRASLILLNCLAFIALLGLILKPHLKTEIPVEIILHTTTADQSYNEIELDNNNLNYFLSEINEASFDTIFKFEDKKKKSLTNIHHLKTPDQILIKHPNLSKLTLLGDGLSQSQWNRFPNLKINYTPPEKIKGIINPRWEENIYLGGKVSFTGQLQTNSSDIYHIKIADPAGEIVTQKKLLNGEYFELTIKPKITGTHQYKVLLADSKDQLIEQNSINLQVKIADSAKILVIQSAPSFETKQLQNWAAENGSQFSIRTRISKEKYITRSSNIPLNHLDLINHKSLSFDLFQYFDLVIINGRELASLNDTDLELLMRSIEKGLGIIILVDHDLISVNEEQQPKILEDFRITRLTQETKIIPYFVSNDQTTNAITDQFISLSAASVSTNNINTSKLLIKSSNGVPIAISQTKKLGRVTVSLLNSTHQLVTSGYQADYTLLWQHLIKNTARKNQEPKILFENNADLLLENSLTQLCYIKSNSAENLIPHLNLSIVNEKATSQQELFINQNALVNDRACGSFWAKSTGWYQVLKLDTKEVLEEFYTLPKNSWLAHQQYRKVSATLAKQAQQINNTENLDEKYTRPINQWVFWWLFFISASLIWLERKFLSLKE